MEMHELVHLWKTADKQLENKVTINKILLKEISLGKVKSHFSQLKWHSALEICFNVLFLLFLVSFCVHHLHEYKYLIPAALLLMSTIGSLAMNSYKLYLCGKIDVKASVLLTQKNLAKIKYVDLLKKNILYVLIPVFSITFLIVIAKAWFNYDLYRMGNYLVYYTAGSFLIGLLIVYLLKRFPDKNLQKSIAFLEQIGEYEKEE